MQVFRLPVSVSAGGPLWMSRGAYAPRRRARSQQHTVELCHTSTAFAHEFGERFTRAVAFLPDDVAVDPERDLQARAADEPRDCHRVDPTASRLEAKECRRS